VVVAQLQAHFHQGCTHCSPMWSCDTNVSSRLGCRGHKAPFPLDPLVLFPLRPRADPCIAGCGEGTRVGIKVSGCVESHKVAGGRPPVVISKGCAHQDVPSGTGLLFFFPLRDVPYGKHPSPGMDIGWADGLMAVEVLAPFSPFGGTTARGTHGMGRFFFSFPLTDVLVHMHRGGEHAICQRVAKWRGLLLGLGSAFDWDVGGQLV